MSTRTDALLDLERLFDLIAEEYRDKGLPLPVDTTAIVNV
jgi:hypothetical protein